ncbi:sodium-dependent transporter [Helicobacter sp. T3_23-1059]
MRSNPISQLGFSKIGFVLSALGRSIGLGHIWRFPYMAGENGGGAFVLLFLVLALCVGVSLLIAEMLLGNKGRSDMPTCFATLAQNPQTSWRYAGFALFGGGIILSFYCVILGWILYYLVRVSFSLPSSMEASKNIFAHLMNDGVESQILCFSAILFGTAFIVSFGIKKGIERLNLILMPLLFIIFIALLIYASFQPGFMRAVHFLFDFRVGDITPSVLISALAQMFFSLSLGVGTIMAYSAMSDEKQNILKSAIWVVIPGLIISLVAGLMIFTFYFGYDGELGKDSGQSINLVFISLPLIFGEFGSVGIILSVAFLVALLFAGITSSVSMLEPSVYFLINRFRCSRLVATWGVVAVVFFVGVVALYSMSDRGEGLIFGGKSVFLWLDFISASVIMPISVLLSVVFVGFVLSKSNLREYTRDFLSDKAFLVWRFIIRYVSPIVIIGILSYKIITELGLA